MSLTRFSGLVALCLLTLAAQAQQATIAVASNFAHTMKDLAAAFERQSDHSVGLAFGSSGKLYAQIVNGAPFDAFFSADQEKARALEDAARIVPGTRFTYAVGRLALWSATPGRIGDGPDALAPERFDRLAIANPKLAPYGMAAVEALKNLGRYDSVSDRLVQGENIAQTFQFVDTGNADLGFVALSQVRHRDGRENGSAWIVPERLHHPIRQDAVLLSAGADNPAALAFIDFVRSPAGRAIIASDGYRAETDSL